MELEEVKEYLKVEITDDDELIQSLIDASDIYIKNSCGVDYTVSEITKLAQKSLISHWYENRGAVIVGTISKQLEFSLYAILEQIKYCPNIETGTISV